LLRTPVFVNHARRKPGELFAFTCKQVKVKKEMMKFMKRLTREQIAVWLAQYGAGRNRLMWRLVYAVSPALAGLVSIMAAGMDPDNVEIWWYSPEDNGDSLESIFISVDEMITRAATPFGLDNYHVFFASLRAIPGDENGMTGDRAEDTLDKRPARTVYHCEGIRWNDWKRGNGKDVVRAALRDFRPTPEAPITKIQVAVTGNAVARSLRAFDAI